jgi:hypothetical protein
MRSSHSLDRLGTAFDDDRLVADAGLLLPATLAHHLGLGELVETHLDLGASPGRANAGEGSRRRPPWARSCAASAEATSASSTG